MVKTGTFIVTSDQAIYEIVQAVKFKYPDKYHIVISRMGGFHIIMNFFGAVGKLVSNAVIEILFPETHMFTEVTAKKIICSGKDYCKMLRAHSTVKAAIFDLY